MTNRDRTLRLWLAWTAGLLSFAAVIPLTLSFVYAPEAMAGGAPLEAVGLEVSECPGCPLCGMSRGFAAMSHLRPAEAVQYNAGVLAAYPLTWLLALGGPLVIFRTLSRRRKPCP